MSTHESSLLPCSLVLGLLSVVMLAVLFVASSRKTLVSCAQARNNGVGVADGPAKRKDSELISILEEQDVLNKLNWLLMVPFGAARVHMMTQGRRKQFN